MSVRKLMVIGWRIGGAQTALASPMPPHPDLDGIVDRLRWPDPQERMFAKALTRIAMEKARG